MATLYRAALDDLVRVFDRIDDDLVDQAVEEIARARRIALYGVGREGLQIRGFCNGFTTLAAAWRWWAT